MKFLKRNYETVKYHGINFKQSAYSWNVYFHAWDKCHITIQRAKTPSDYPCLKNGMIYGNVHPSIIVLKKAPWVYISQLIRYSRACGSCQDFLDRGLLLTRKLQNQGFLLVKLKSSLGKFYGRHHVLVDCYGISVSQMTTDMFHLS